MSLENNITTKKDNTNSEVKVVKNVTTSEVTSSDKEPKNFRRNDQSKNNRDNKGPRKNFNDRKPKVQSEFIEKVILIRKINKVTTGGRRLRFSAAVAIGNKKGMIGFGISKANEVPDAIKKAIEAAHKNLKTIAISLKNNSVPHEIIGAYCASKILIKPAKEGIGVKAGGAARDIFELVGIQNVYSKSLGTNNKINLARATIAGLTNIKPQEYFLRINDKKKPPVAREKV